MIMKLKLFLFFICLAYLSRCAQNESTGEVLATSGINLYILILFLIENTNSVVFDIGSGVNPSISIMFYF
jgi:hypothetical protein